ncbi:conserved protein of unknown function [Nitrospira japonica]|uniref:Uncharacterized protein n=1 Tax=Nitrospira japonica TaxID=1325564 RepID=A0A1W1I798_9BACT|nr:hypothetical protein [Nitrospira japonica]SLM48918.1 conserved protein of unknown function [Nitrospira japonica]
MAASIGLLMIAPCSLYAEIPLDHMAGSVDAMVPHQRHLGPHMRWTSLRPVESGDERRADQIVQVLRSAIEKYRDYRVAESDGFVLLHPERTAKHYHFANRDHRQRARSAFDAAEPTALLYKKNGEGYELEGAMYTAPKDMDEDQLNRRIPLSIAQWHAHINICLAPDGSRNRMSRRSFGFKGTIVLESECREAGGQFVSQAGGWMIHVYPFESTRGRIWTH